MGWGGCLSTPAGSHWNHFQPRFLFPQGTTPPSQVSLSKMRFELSDGALLKFCGLAALGNGAFDLAAPRAAHSF